MPEEVLIPVSVILKDGSKYGALCPIVIPDEIIKDAVAILWTAGTKKLEK